MEPPVGAVDDSHVASLYHSTPRPERRSLLSRLLRRRHLGNGWLVANHAGSKNSASTKPW